LAALNGPSAAEHAGRTIHEVLGSHADVVEPILRRVMETGVPVTNREITAAPPATPDRLRSFLANYFPVRTPSGETIGIGAAIVEITDRKEVEARLEKALSIPTVGVLFFDLMGRILDANPALERLSGYSRDELRELPWQTLTPPEFEAVTARAAQDVGDSGETAPYEKQWIRPDGSRWWGLFAPTRISGTGSQSECVEFIVDITARKQTEEALRESELQFRTLADNISQFAWMTDETGSISWFNRRWFEYTGTTLDEVKGWGWQKVHHPEHARRVVEKIRHHFETGEIWEDTFPLRGKDGRYRWFLSRALPIRDEAGHVVRWFGTNTDVTETRLLAEVTTVLSSSLDYRETLKRMAELLVPTMADECVVQLLDGDAEMNRIVEVHSGPSDVPLSHVVVPLTARGRTLGAMDIVFPESNIRYGKGVLEFFQEVGRRAAIAIDNARLYEDAQRAIHMREEILAVVSHDLKNPLGAIQMAGAMLLRRQVADPRSRKQNEVINRSGSRMEHLIGDLLDIASIQAGRLAIEQKLEEPDEVVVEAAEIYEAAAREKGVVIVRECEPQGPPIPIDRDRILQVLGNLLGNAIKFCRSGDIISVRCKRSADHILFSVADTGPGIPDCDLSHVFEPYWSAKAHAKKGTGLGLYISKGVVEAHGGRLWVESKHGEGATFYFTLPIPVAS
ncbi:MAG: PAS domain S-box protein, partial [Polyangiaceae bacterium]|nr:PAS domain S-box protein [Polyangiaceae bacterium]